MAETPSLSCSAPRRAQDADWGRLLFPQNCLKEDGEDDAFKISFCDANTYHDTVDKAVIDDNTVLLRLDIQ